MQACIEEHSEFVTHSGLQLGGEPIKSFKHEQEGLSPFALHSELGPQGEGLQGSLFLEASN